MPLDRACHPWKPGTCRKWGGQGNGDWEDLRYTDAEEGPLKWTLETGVTWLQISPLQKVLLRAQSPNHCPALGGSHQGCTHQAPPSMGFSRQEYWSGLLCPPPGDFSDSGIEPEPLVFPVMAGGFFTIKPPGIDVWNMTLWEEEIVHIFSFLSKVQ